MKIDLTSTTEFADRMDEWMRGVKANPLTALAAFPLKAVGIVVVGVIAVILIIDLLGYFFSSFQGRRSSYTPFSRNVMDTVTDAWDNRNSNFIGNLIDPYHEARSLDSMTEVLDSLSGAYRKWSQEEPMNEQINALRAAAAKPGQRF